MSSDSNLKPRIAFCVTFPTFGSYDTDSSRKIAGAPPRLLKQKPSGNRGGTVKCRADTALSEAARKLILPHSKLEGEANILIMPNLDTANVAYQMIKALGRCAFRLGRS